jgi:hypothetical protein
MNRVKVIGVFLTCIAVGSISCVKHETLFSAHSDISDDGSIDRKGSMEILVSGDRDVSKDSLNAAQFYSENYVAPDENLFDISRDFRDSLMIISWEGRISAEDIPVSDYIHKSKEGSTAINNISITVRNRWVYKDIIYTETFSDPVDTVKYFPMIRTRLSGASESILKHEALKGIRDYDGAGKLLDRLETTAGLDLFKGILADPAQFDTISEIYDENISIVADSLAGFAGVKQNPDSLDRIIHNVYDAAWDTLLSDYPGLFGSFALDDFDIHNFRVEVVAPGCLISSNSDTTIGGVSAWSFDRMDFFARDYSIEMVARQWRWFNVAVTVLAIAVVLFFILRPVRRKRIG